MKLSIGKPRIINLVEGRIGEVNGYAYMCHSSRGVCYSCGTFNNCFGYWKDW